ncbi:hypothetical protein MNO14_01865 [Luteimonas sp. S4-F44]|uniref:hypothetical protein n=1 Tax=Luteimonas sp. S4-F44 TaxID=2925842 RepID=UPI001F52EA52|nr:hypothetical protein [Luteimonas sp. S4-F44]UNK42879.1 hypothetical protein MNO14_01865 [Luteimonas sp. S4-F44]
MPWQSRHAIPPALQLRSSPNHRVEDAHRAGGVPAILAERARHVSTALKAYALLATNADKWAVRDRCLLGN